MRFGITMIPADYAVSPVRLGVLVETYGFDSIWLGEHSHIPVSRQSAYPSGGELPEEFSHFHDTMISLAAIASVTSRISLGMSTLVMLGSSAAFFYSVAVLLVPGWFPPGTAHTYFEASSAIITLILVGKHFEAIAKGRTSSAIRRRERRLSPYCR